MPALHVCDTTDLQCCHGVVTREVNTYMLGLRGRHNRAPCSVANAMSARMDVYVIQQ
jgi:hypothetical protein